MMFRVHVLWVYVRVWIVMDVDFGESCVSCLRSLGP